MFHNCSNLLELDFLKGSKGSPPFLVRIYLFHAGSSACQTIATNLSSWLSERWGVKGEVGVRSGAGFKGGMIEREKGVGISFKCVLHNNIICLTMGWALYIA